MENPYSFNTSVLAFVGDGAYELYIRSLVVSRGTLDPGALHNVCTEYVRAESQAHALKKLMNITEDGRGFLTEDELRLVKRARNHKTPNRSRSADPVEYRLATALEALIGCHYISGDESRMKEIMDKVVSLIEEEL